MISVKNLTFTYPGAKKETLQNVNFNISKGEILGFLGPSGSGKSTTQNILIGLLKKYIGSVKIMDKEIFDWGNDLYEHIGVSFELPNHYLKLTAFENLEYFKSLYTNKTHDSLTVLEWVGLKDDANKKVSDFSKGMKIRLNIARSLIHNPKILFLDEPTAGLDPGNAHKIRDLILKIREQGTTIFITTHNMMLADNLCDRVAFISSGKLNIIDTPSNLKKKYGKRIVTIEYDNNKAKEFPLDDLADENFFSFLKSLKKIETIHSEETTLDTVFIKVTGEALSNE